MTPEPAATHRETVERWVALFNDDRDAWHAALPPGIVIETDAAWPDGGRFEGSEAASRFVRFFEETWSSVRFQIEEIEDVGDAIMTRSRWLVVGTTSGVETELAFTAVFVFDPGGQVAEVRVFFDPDEAREFAARGPAKR
jgi:hypothetical protein